MQLIKQLEYNHWANVRLSSSLLEISAEQAQKEILSSFPSVMKTVLHIWDAEYIWMQRMHGVSLKGFPSKDFSGSYKASIEGLIGQSKEWVEFMESTEMTSTSEIKYSNTKGEPFISTLDEIVQHLTIHGSFHRGQLVTMLRQIGVSQFKAMDYIVFSRS